MKSKYCAKKEEVKLFLETLKNILNDKEFNLKRDLDILLKKKNENPLDQYTTMNTLAELNYDKEDIKRELLNLSIEDYIETLIDIKEINGPKLYVFIKYIIGKAVYIKIKIRSIQNRKIFCISFHFARYENFNYPYKGVSKNG